jgi:hypothetical protein
MNIDMGMNILRGFLADIVMVALLCWILMKLSAPNFSRIFTV